MDDRPRVGGLAPAAFGLFGRQADYGAETEVGLEFAGFDEDAAPDDGAGFADAFERAAAEGEVHGGLPLAGGPGIATDEVVGGCGAGDLEEPDEFVEAGAGEVLAPADVVQRGGGVEAERGPDAIGDEAIDAGALVDLVEVDERAAGKEFGLAGFGEDGWTFAVVEEAFDEVGGYGHVLETLLVLDADGVAAEVVGDADGGEFGLGVGTEVEVDAFVYEPLVYGLRFGVADCAHFGDECGLAEALFIDAGGVEELVVDDGVVHAHAALVEDAEDGLAVL